MEYIIKMPEGTSLPCLCEFSATCNKGCVFSRLDRCPLSSVKKVLTLEEYQKKHPERPTGNKAQELYIVE